MFPLNFSENISRLRHEKKITQEQLADFVGVTKASVSKWETGQSMPDVLLLSQIAAYFDVTIDELLGYDPQLSKEQIRKIYVELSKGFAREPFDSVMVKCRSLVKRYYSCYPFLFQIAALYLNHFMLPEDGKKQQEILSEASELCQRVTENCKEIGLCNDALYLDAMIKVQMGQANEVIASLEESLSPFRLFRQGDGILIQAYQLAGENKKANEFTQASMFTQLLSLVSEATEYLAIHSNDLEVCEETIRRVMTVMEVYGVENLNPNTAILFCHQAAIVYCIHGKKQEALAMLTRFVRGVEWMMKEEKIKVHSDDYFNALDVWIEQLDNGGNAPRDRKVILESGVQAMYHPAFGILDGDEAFLELKETLLRLE